MTFKIRHETKAVLVICLVSFIIAFIAFMSANVIGLYIGIFFESITILSAIMYFVEQITGTKIIIGWDDITIKYFIGYKKFLAADIKSIDIEKYHRYRHGHGAYTEYRMRMKIELSDGRKITLTDKATATTGLFSLILAKRVEMENEDVELYKAYLSLKDLMA